MWRLVPWLVSAAMIAGCTKTDDYLREQFRNHSEILDPESAIFRNVGVGSSGVWCGEVNLKNRINAYVGWHPFLIIVGDDGKTSVTVREAETAPIRAPIGGYSEAAKNYERSMNDLAAALSAAQDSMCANAKPATAWVPIWK